MKYNLLIVEDHELTRYGLVTAFENVDFINKIYEAGEAQTAISLTKVEPIDVIIMDLGLPGLNGIEAIQIIKNINSNIKFVILTSHVGTEEVIASLKAGANSYCSKEIKPKNLVEVVKSTINGASWFDPKVSNLVLSLFNKQELQSIETKTQIDYKLTSREKQVLKLMTEGLQNQDIAQKLCVSINTTKAHVCAILQKLDVEDRTQAVVKAIKDHIV